MGRLTAALTAAVLLVSLLVGVAGAGTAAAQSYEIEINGVDAPDEVKAGEQVEIRATASGDLAASTPIELRLIRTDTGQVLCEDSGLLPGSFSCTGRFEMPEEDVTVRAEFGFPKGEVVDEQSVTIAAKSPEETMIDGMTGAFEDGLEDGLAGPLQEGMLQFFLGMFEEMLSILVETVVRILTATPDVHPNPPVEEVHRQTLYVTYSLAGLGLMAIGLLYMVGPILGISYHQVRPLLPRLIVAMVFASVSLHVLQLMVDGTVALTEAFRPPQMDIGQLAGVGVGMILVYVINAVFLLALAAVFLMRDVYILFVAAISPLLAFAWVFPRARRYADSFIAAWFAALLMAPLDMLVFRFIIALMDGNGATFGQAVSNWLFGVAGFALLLFVPWQLYGASQAGVAAGHTMAGGAVQRIREYRQGQTVPDGSIDDRWWVEEMELRDLQQGGHDPTPKRTYDPDHGVRSVPGDQIEKNRFYVEGDMDDFREGGGD